MLYLSLHLVAWWSFIFNWEKSSFQTFISLYFCVSLAVSLPRTFSTLTHNGTIGINHHAYLRNIVSLSVQCVSLGLLCKIWQNPVNDPCEPSDTIPDTEEITTKLTNHPWYIAWWRHQTEKIINVIGPLCGEFTDHRWIPITKASDAVLWCFLWSAPEQTFEQTLNILVIWDAIDLIMRPLLRFLSSRNHSFGMRVISRLFSVF